MTTPLIRSTIGLFVDGGIDPTELQYFDISACRGAVSEERTDPLMHYRPPFARCCVVWGGATRSHAAYEVIMIVGGTDPEEGVIVNVWKGPVGIQPRALPAMVYVVDGDMLRYGPVDESEEVTREEAEVMLGLVAAWYGSLARGCESYVPSVRASFTNRRKLAQGKAPTYDWRTVYIQPVRPRSEARGGTHASPRLHDRRGHLRRLQSGRNVWVMPCKVGSAALGTVFHDYEVRA